MCRKGKREMAKRKIYDTGNYKEILVRNLLVYREKNGYGQKDVCEALNLTIQTYSKYEHGDSKSIPMDVLMDLCNLYQIHLDALLVEKADETRPAEMNLNVFTAEQQEALQAACQKVLQPGEKIVHLDDGRLQIHHHSEGDIGLHVEALRNVFQFAQDGYEASMAEMLRAELDSAETRCVTAEEARLGRKLATEMGIDFTKYLAKYSLIWAPFLRHYQLSSLSEEPAKRNDAYKRSRGILRFHSVLDLLYIEYFTNQHPLRFIEPELEEIEAKLKEGKDFSPDMYYRRMNILIYGDYEHPIGLEVRALQEMQAEGRKMGCFQDHPHFRKELPAVEKWYLRSMGFGGNQLDAFMKMHAAQRYRLLGRVFFMCFGDKEKIREHLKSYYDARYFDHHGMRWGRI